MLKLLSRCFKTYFKPSHYHKTPNVSLFFSTGFKRSTSMNASFCADIKLERTRIVCQACEDFGFELRDETDDDCFLIMRDILLENEIKHLKPYQKVNRFLNIQVLTHKQNLAKVLKRAQNLSPCDFHIAPKTWLLPEDMNSFRQYAEQNNGYFIVKPNISSCGSGIHLITDATSLEVEDAIVQQYIEPPSIIEDKKYDLRLYVLVTSIDPLKIYLHQNGMVRLATKKYESPSESNKKDFYAHLTNTSLNATNKDAQSSLTRTLDWFRTWLDEEGKNSQLIFQRIEELVIKTFLVGQPYMEYSYNLYKPAAKPSNGDYCFHLIGVDVMLDADDKLWLIELNAKPSFYGQLKDMKRKIFTDILNILDIKPSDRQKDDVADENAETFENEKTQKINGFKQIYPCLTAEEQHHYKTLYECSVTASKDFLVEADNYRKRFTEGRLAMMISEEKPKSRSKSNTYEGKVAEFLKELQRCDVICLGITEESIQSIKNKCKSDWQSDRLIDYWMKTLSSEERFDIQNERGQLLVVLMQRVWKVFEEEKIKHVKLYQTMCALLEYLLSRDGYGLVESCLLFAEVSIVNFVKDYPENLTESELKCCVRILELYQSIVVVHCLQPRPDNKVYYRPK